MEHLYQKHFGLNQAPFNITPDPSFLYESESHREGLAQLLYGINARRGFIVLTGEVGTGKTTLIQAMLQQLAEDTHTALIFSAITSPLDLLRYVCEEFILIEPRQAAEDAHDYINLLNDFLLQKYRDGQNAALIIDEAQNLSLEVLEGIRLLSNFETTKDKILQIVLVGQPELTERLNTPQLRQLKQRVTLRHHLRTFTLAESQQYIACRVKRAAGNPGIFLPRTIEAIHQYSGGIPRLINVLCDNAMVSAYALDRRVIEPLMVQEVAEDLHLATTATRLTAIRRDPSPKTEVRNAIRIEGTKPPLLPIAKPIRLDAVPEPVNMASEKGLAPEKFLISLREALIDAMGPMGQVVLKEQIKLLGGSADRFPQEKVSALIESVSREIFDEAMRDAFRRTIYNGFNMARKA